MPAPQHSSALRPTLLFRGCDILTVGVDPKGSTTHPLANLKVKYTPSPRALIKLAGAKHLGVGIYLCFYDGKLFYVGIFAGLTAMKRGSVIRERWRKHVAGMTLRGRGVTICRSGIEQIRLVRPLGELETAILGTDVDIMADDKGLQATFDKYMFAARRWDEFRILNNRSMHRFQFAYVACGEDHLFNALDKDMIKRELKEVETRLVEAHNPPCNGESPNETGVTTTGILETVRATRAALGSHIEGYMAV